VRKYPIAIELYFGSRVCFEVGSIGLAVVVLIGCAVLAVCLVQDMERDLTRQRLRPESSRGQEEATESDAQHH